MILFVHVKPNSKVDQVSFEENGEMKVKIRAQPVDGKANKYLEEYLAKVFGVSKSQIQIVKGSTGQHKKIEIKASEEYITGILHGLKGSK